MHKWLAYAALLIAIVKVSTVKCKKHLEEDSSQRQDSIFSQIRKRAAPHNIGTFNSKINFKISEKFL